MAKTRCPRCNSQKSAIDGDTTEFRCGTWVRAGEVNQSQKCINIAMMNRDTAGENDGRIFPDFDSDNEAPEIDQW